MPQSSPHVSMFDSPANAKLRSALLWARRKLGNVEHERRVTQIATTLFRLTQLRHEMSQHDLSVLKFGAVLHDVGRRVDERKHPTVGAKMIENDRPAPLFKPQLVLLELSRVIIIILGSVTTIPVLVMLQPMASVIVN